MFQGGLSLAAAWRMRVDEAVMYVGAFGRLAAAGGATQTPEGNGRGERIVHSDGSVTQKIGSMDELAGFLKRQGK